MRANAVSLLDSLVAANLPWFELRQTLAGA
jgi:hypothetical protein